MILPVYLVNKYSTQTDRHIYKIRLALEGGWLGRKCTVVHASWVWSFQVRPLRFYWRHCHDNFGHYFVGRGPQFQNDFSGPKWRGWVGSPTWEKVPKSHSFFLSGCGSPNNFLRKIPFTCVTVTWPRADLCPHLKIRQMLFCQVALKWLFMIMLLNVPKLRTQ